MASKSKILADDYGYSTIEDMLMDTMFSSVVPGICTNEDCDATYECEPDAEANWCSECDTQTVKSCLILEGLI